MTSDVLVTGDATLDWHVLRAGATPNDSGELPPGDVSPLDPHHHHVFIEWVRDVTPASWRAARVLGRQAWSELPDKEREKDRELVRQIPRILGAAGYTIARAAE